MAYILAADDEPINLDIIEDTLMDTHEVACVEDGEACLASIKKRMPDLVLLDGAMPRINGFEVCRQLKSDEATHALPVIILSGYASSAHISQGIEAGADKYIAKPFMPDELIDAVEALLKHPDHA